MVTSIGDFAAEDKPQQAVEFGNDQQWIYRIAMTLMDGIGPVLARQLISYCGSVEAVFRHRKRQLERVPGIGPERASIITSSGALKKAELEWQFIKQHDIQAFFYLDAGYPQRLRNCDDAPLMLFYKGTKVLNHPRSIAVVGTRHCTPEGRDLTAEFINGLKVYDVCIVSGLAYGIDIVAHKEAVRHGLPTIGVTAHGLDRLYPSVHRPVSDKMILHGGLLTEYPSGTKPDRDNFPARNRIVAGMTDATVVIESAEKGGALITADFANDYNREVFSIPGRPTDRMSKGCNLLIRQNRAMLLESPDQLAEAMNWSDAKGKENAKEEQLRLFCDLTEDEMAIVNCLRNRGPLHLDILSYEVSRPVGNVASILLGLEFKELVKCEPGKMFRLV